MLPAGQTYAAEYTQIAKNAIRPAYGILDFTIIDAKLGTRHTVASGIVVRNKREALARAKAEGATPWNF